MVVACKSWDLICVVSSWLTDDWDQAKSTIASVPDMPALLQSYASQLWRAIVDNLDKVIAGAGTAFGIWRWWRYREAILHKRLVEYIAESDARLEPTSRAAIETILRPNRPLRAPQPHYAIELRRVLFSNSWGGGIFAPFLGLVGIERRTQWQLRNALRRVRRRHAAAMRSQHSLLEQQAQIHLIMGAMTAARARKKSNRIISNRLDESALREFRHVLRFPGHHRDIAAKENEAFQLLRLGQLRPAFAAYEELEKFASDIGDVRRKDLTIARALRYRAQIIQLETPEGGRLSAYQLLKDTTPNAHAAIALLNRHTLLDGWEAIESAETHYLTAFVANRQDFSGVAPEQLKFSEETYRSVADRVSLVACWFSHRDRSLKKAAMQGLERVRRARTGDYDDEWLGVRSTNSDNLPSDISQTSGNQTVADAGSQDRVNESTASQIAT